MRIRSIKPEFWSSDDITALHWYERLLFIGLWSYVDDHGVGRDRLASIAGDLFSGDIERDHEETYERVKRGLEALAARGLIQRYEVDGKRYLHITGWSRHQRIVNPSKAKYPLPTDARDPRDTLATGSRGSSETLASVSPPSPDHLTTNPAALAGSAKAPEAAAASVPAASVENAALTGHSSDPRDTLARASRDSSETLGTGTGEQRNRGTGESSSSNAADAAPDGDAEPIEVSTEARTFCDLLLALMAKNDERPRPAKVTNAWLIAADRMFRIDGRDGATALGLLRWAKQDDFWSPNVQSPAKFRQQWEKIARDSKRAVKGDPRERRHLSIVEELRAEEQRSIGSGS